jgi:hypothetical protein
MLLRFRMSPVLPNKVLPSLPLHISLSPPYTNVFLEANTCLILQQWHTPSCYPAVEFYTYVPLCLGQRRGERNG